MKAAVTDGKGNLMVQEVPRPIVGPYQALVKNLACAICNGTDTKIIDGQLFFVSPSQYPAILGHESVGQVVEVGSKVRKFKVGDVVLRTTTVVEGLHSLWGGFAEFALVADAEAAGIMANTIPGPQVWAMQQKVPHEIDPVEATILVTLKECYSSLKNLYALPGSSLLVTGTGPVAQAFVRLAPLVGFKRVVGAGRRPEALELLMNMGAEQVFNLSNGNVVEQIRAYFGGRGVDYAVDTTDAFHVIDCAARVLASGGRVGVYGVAPSASRAPMPEPPPGTAVARLNPNEAAAHEDVLRLIRSGKVTLKEFISDVMPLEEITEAIHRIHSREASKIVITFC